MPFIVLAVIVGLETWGIVQATQRFGGGATLLALAAGAVAGVWLIRHGGVTALRRIQMAVARGELPAVEVFAGLITAFAGLLLLLPGFVTDVMALSLLLAGRSLRAGLAQKMSAHLAQARPDLKQPVTLDGEFQRK